MIGDVVRRVLSLALIVGSVLVPGIATLPGAAAPPTEIDCAQPVPDPSALQAAALGAAGGDVQLDVVALLDGVPRDLGVRYMRDVAAIYEPLGIRLRVAYRVVRFAGPPGDGIDRESLLSLIPQARELFGGRRPAGVEVVHVLTAKKYGGGHADCIGGVRFPEFGFSAAQATLTYPQMLRPAPVNTVTDASPVLHAHEIGHLLGGHHHLANCVQGIGPGDLSPPELSPCTVMSPAAPWASSPVFDTVNGTIIRGHALAYSS